MSTKKAMRKLQAGPQTSTKVVKCFCESSFQDEHYGKGRRLANITGKEAVYRCTVCGKDVNI
jgi:predicted SprT family Zn-dependent metalloprotease